jgi:peptide/nickel transport system permease protein
MTDVPAKALPTPFSDPLRFEGGVKARVSARPMILARRLAIRVLTHVLPLMLTIIIATFILVHSMPGSFVEIMTSEMQLSDQATIHNLNVTYGLDQPLYIQLGKYLWAVAHLDLGFSYRQNVPVIQAIWAHLPATIILMLAALSVSVLIGVGSGVISATWRNGLSDRLLSAISVFLFAAPSFWVGVMLMVVFSVNLGWLPVGDMRTIGGDYGVLGDSLDLGLHLILPALALGLHQSAIYMRVTRAAMIDAMQADFVRTARAKGLSGRIVTFRHILRNAVLPIVTMIGLQFSAVMSGSIVVESVFNWPGIGLLLYNAVVARDYPIVLGVIILSSFVVILVNLVVDLVYAWLDPRIVLN